jgi:hypothetical protein
MFVVDTILLNNLQINLFVGRVFGGRCWSSYLTLAGGEWRLAMSLPFVLLFVDSSITKRIFPGIAAPLLYRVFGTIAPFEPWLPLVYMSPKLT